MKKVFIGLGVLVLVLGIVLWRVYVNLDKIVAKVIEDAGTEVTQTAVRVSGVDLDLLHGRAGLSQLSVANPAGFSRPEIFSLELVSVAIDVNSVSSNPIIIDEIVVRQPRVVYEMNQQGTSNLDVLKKNVESYSPSRATGSGSATEKQESAGQEGEEIKLIIRKLSFEGGELNATSALRPDKPVKARLPAFTMSNIGQSSGGATSSQIAKEVLDKLVRQAAAAASKAGVDKLTAELKDKAKEKLGDKVGGALKGLLGD
jgi:AsmA family